MTKLFQVVEYSVRSGGGAHTTRKHKINLTRGEAKTLANRLNRKQDLPTEGDCILSYKAEPMS